MSTHSYKDLLAQREALEQQIAAARKTEVADAVQKIKGLIEAFGLTQDDVIRHYDVTGKNCPKYYVENPDAWIQMKSDIAVQIDVDYGLQDVQ